MYSLFSNMYFGFTVVGFIPSPITFRIDHEQYIFEPGLHHDIKSWCRTRYGADLVFIDTVEVKIFT